MAVYRPNPVLLERQLDSLRAQTVADWRCLVGIDGHDPETLARVHHLIGSDNRFDVVPFDDNVGVYRHFERLLARIPTDTPWVALADQDDYWYPEKFAMLLSSLEAPGVAATTGQARLVNTAGDVLGITNRRPGDLLQTLTLNQLTGGMTMFRGQVLEIAFPFPPETDIAIHDHWLAVCSATVGRIARLDSVLQDYVQHEANVLGEVRHKPLRQSVVDAGGVTGLMRSIDYMSLHFWGWFAAMAATLLPRGVPRDAERAVTLMGCGRMSIRIACVLAGHVFGGRMPLRVAGALFVAGLRWPKVAGRAQARP